MRRGVAASVCIGLMTPLLVLGTPAENLAQSVEIPLRAPGPGAKVAFDLEGMWVVQDRLLVLAADGGLHAFDPETGQAAWRFQAGSRKPGDSMVELPRGASFQESLSIAMERLPKSTWGVTGPPVFEGETAYVGSSDGSVYALDIGTGQQKWSAPKEGAGAAGVLMRHGDMLFVTSQSSVLAPDPARSTVLALDAATGQKRWSFDTQPGLLPREKRPPQGVVADDPLLYVTSWPFHGVGTAPKVFLHAIDMKTGRSPWAFQVDGCDPTAPAAAGDVVLFHSMRCIGLKMPEPSQPTLYAVERSSGQLRWKLKTELEWRGPERIAVTSDIAVFATDRGVFAVALGTGEERWSFRRELRYPILWLNGQAVYALSEKGTMHALDLASGRERWSFKGGFVAAVRDDVLYVGGGGKLHALRADSGAKLWSSKTGGGHPSFWHERLFVASPGEWIFGKEPKPGYLYNLSAKTGRLEP